MNQNEFTTAVLRKIAEKIWSAIPAEIQLRMTNYGLTIDQLGLKLQELISKNLISDRDFEAFQRECDVSTVVDEFATEIAASKSFDIEFEGKKVGEFCVKSTVTQ